MENVICTVCGNNIQEKLNGHSVTYTTEDNYNVVIPCDDAISALIASSDGSFWICNECYPDAVSKRFSGAVLAEIHYAFGLDYQDKKVIEMARICFLRALAIDRKADYLAALGAVSDRLDEEYRLYNEALAIDPTCLIARLNLLNMANRTKT